MEVLVKPGRRDGGAPGQAIVSGKDLMKHGDDGTTVEQEVMERPDEAEVVFSHAQEGEPHQRSSGEIEGREAVRVQEGGEILYTEGLFLPEKLRAFPDELPGLRT